MLLRVTNGRGRSKYEEAHATVHENHIRQRTLLERLVLGSVVPLQRGVLHQSSWTPFKRRRRHYHYSSSVRCLFSAVHRGVVWPDTAQEVWQEEDISSTWDGGNCHFLLLYLAWVHHLYKCPARLSGTLLCQLCSCVPIRLVCHCCGPTLSHSRTGTR